MIIKEGRGEGVMMLLLDLLEHICLHGIDS